jgi:hypothetical protein
MNHLRLAAIATKPGEISGAAFRVGLEFLGFLTILI